MHGGFVGMGMLDAACPGEVFTSPTPDQMEAATKAVDGGAGVIHIVKNYTGDVMNFEMAAELCRAEGIEVESVLVDDDVAVQDSLYTAGRRGVGTTVLLEKIAGAAAEEGRGAARRSPTSLARSTRTGAAWAWRSRRAPCPAAGKPTFELGEDEFEIGIGIHGEPGRERMKMKPVAEIVERWRRRSSTTSRSAGRQVLAFVNGMGGTPLIELYIVFNELASSSTGTGITISRNLIGSYITSLEMAGCSITLLQAGRRVHAPVGRAGEDAGLRWGV